jgi:RNA polymerase sigma-70 factor (ECF subfamily)
MPKPEDADQPGPVDLLPTRASLLNRLKNWGDEASWREFFDIYWRLIYGTARRAGLSEAEAQDVVQETVLCVARKIKDFTYDPARGSFKGWLLKLTHWRIVDQKRGRTLPSSPDTPTSSLDTEPVAWEEIPDPAADLEVVWNRDWQTNLLEAALERVKLKVRPEHYQIFDLYAVKEWSAAKVAQVLGVNEDQVYLIKHRVTEAIKAEVHKLETMCF